MTDAELEEGVTGLPSVLLSWGGADVAVGDEVVLLQGFELETPVLKGGVTGPPIVGDPYVVLGYNADVKAGEEKPLEGPVTGLPSVLPGLLEKLVNTVTVDGPGTMVAELRVKT